MLRTIRQFVIGTALLTLFLSMSPTNAQAATGPCSAGDGQVDATVCAEFLAYVRDSIALGSASVSMTIPESTMASGALSYAHNWDANPVAYLPESTVVREAARYIPNWDANSVAYLPESTMGIDAPGYVHGWDANPVAYIPESTMGIAVSETLGLQNAGK